MKKTTLIVSFSCLLTNLILAQESLNSSGQSVSASEYSMDYSIGQLLFSVNQNESYSISEGVIQVEEVEATILDSEREMDISVFPNPSTHYLMIKSSDANFKFAVYNLQGQILKKGIIERKEYSINISELPRSTYLLLITDKNQNQRSFKLIKN